MQIPTSPPLVGHNPRRNIALSLNGAPTNRDGISAEIGTNQSTNWKGPFSQRRFMSVSFLRLYTDIHLSTRALQSLSDPEKCEEENISWDEFEMQCKLDLL